jgi:effector-binding domain-containing protein
MAREPQLQQRDEQHYVGIRASVPMDGISGAIDEAIPQLFGWLAAKGIAPAGPPFLRFLVIDMMATMRIEIGVPVGEPVTAEIIGPEAANGRVRPGVLPGGRYAVLRHIGSYDGLIASNAALQEWAAAQGVTFDTWDTPEGSAWRSRVEHYLTDPSAEPDPAKWETDVAYLTSDG